MRYDTIILGAGAAGMMCATQCGGRALVLDHAKAPGEKIRISGGGRCNFTNMYAGPENFLSQNPHFCKSALSRYTQWDFIDLVARHGIPYHEKTLGQLFCDDSARDIIGMLRTEMDRGGAELRLNTQIVSVSHDGTGFEVETETQGQRTTLRCQNLVLATGGKSIPKMGATGLAYDIARQFGLSVTETRPALVPFTFSDNPFKALSGTALPVCAEAGSTRFDEAMLFTHRGLSGPAMLQISSFWREGDDITINLLPEHDPFETLRARRQSDGRRNLSTILAQMLPAKLADHLSSDYMGESFGPWVMGDDLAVLDVVTSANIACGMHAGDPDVMARTMAAARDRGVGIGAHPGFADLQGFGRYRMSLPEQTLGNLIRYQIGAAQAMARSVGAEVRHLKLHGALANMASEDRAMALACYRAALSVAPEIIVMVLAGTAQQAAVEELGCAAACEIFADRAYNDDATLVDRSLPGAMIRDPDRAAARMVDMIGAGAIITESGKTIPTRIDTICLHGDTPEAVQIARATRAALEAAGIEVTQFAGAKL